jgi:KaiC/GvpD/RAD55 family RecA-like ATPase
MATMDKVKTGVTGLDEMLDGGLVANRPYVLVGPPGAGKTILGMQFLMEGAKMRENGLYVSLEESQSELAANMSIFGWDLVGSSVKVMDTSQDFSTEKWLIKTDSIMSKPEFSLANLLTVLHERLAAYKPQRMVIDSLTSVKMLYEKDFEMRRGLLSLMYFLFRCNATTMLTSTKMSENLMEESLASGIIKMHKIDNRGEMLHAVSVEKMRGSDFDATLRPLKITNKGLVVFNTETVFK